MIHPCLVYNKYLTIVCVGLDPAFRSRMTCVRPRAHRAWYAALPALELAPWLPNDGKASGSHPARLKHGGTGLCHRSPLSLWEIPVYLRLFFSGRDHTPTFLLLAICSCATLCFSASCTDQVVCVFAWQTGSVK